MRIDQLGVQAHCLRHRIGAGLEPVLAQIAARGLHAIELVCFPGCRNNHWGDFGVATDMPPPAIAAALAQAQLTCPSVMVTESELAGDRLAATLAWIRGVGSANVVLTAFAHEPTPTLAQWLSGFERLADYARRCRDSGLQFVLHTAPELWQSVEEHTVADLLLDWLDPSLMRIEFDPSGAINHGLDPSAFLQRRAGVFHAMHLRDGHTPARPAFYLPAEPLGTGVVEWRKLLAAARAAGVEWYFLEMEVADYSLVWQAIDSSLSYLADLPPLGRCRPEDPIPPPAPRPAR